MKKLALLLSLALVLNACKQKEAKTETESEKPQMMAAPADAVENDCSIFNQMDSLTVPQKVTWLRDHQGDICKAQYDDCREKKHLISEKEFEDAVSAYWGTKTAKYLNMELANIEALTTDVEYQKFIKATADTNNNITLSAVTNFNATDVQYSVPLFYSIARIHSLDGKSVFNFTLAKIDGQTKIVFSVTGTNTFYDMSGNPL